ncbi:MAG: hypothetical protein QE271_10440 [Bacteriovoracaceae bacterium]|nr:hypothetical protein [Bacteriovoracaceae bacterium]
MAVKKLVVMIDENIKAAADLFCEVRGIKLKNFLEEAILDRLEEYGDALDSDHRKDIYH